MALVKSSSIHSLNADKGLSIRGRRFWYSLNWLDNSLFPNWKERRLAIKKFTPHLSADDWQRNSNGRIASYTGLDEQLHPDWPEVMKQNSFIKLQQADSAQFASLIPAKTNLFISQSAIEHFPEDLTYFRQLRDFISARPSPALQIHLFPSAACLQLYRYHGVRQYTPRTVSAITRLFPHSICTLFELGGPTCNALHWDFITKPILLESGMDRRDTETAAYTKELHSAIEADVGEMGEPSFYALMVHSHFGKSITEQKELNKNATL